MKAIHAGGIVDLGDVETAPTIGIIDYSRRVTDDFGVTTVVERGFSRTLSVRLGVPFNGVDALQRSLANLRAAPAQWVANDQIAWLSPNGFFKTFDIDLSVPPLSLCTLTVEGFAEAEALPDAGGDPALEGSVSTLRLLQPVDVTDAVLIASNVAEIDAPEWLADAVYAAGARVRRGASHRVFESLIAGNSGYDPATVGSAHWLDVGPTARWAMFDQALGTATSADGSISVTLAAGAVTAVALLDAVGATVRVQAPGYDMSALIGAGSTTFLDLPGIDGQVTVTIAGNSTVSVGTLLVGHLVSLGVTEASPSAGITDYSRKDIDDFGAVTIVQRAWSKRMTAKALIRTDAVDAVANRIAAVRATPALWIGQAGIDSLTVYGFFKDFSIEVGETTSKLSLSIEGFSAAAKIEPLKVAWPDVTDPVGTKPEDSATVGAPGTTIVGGTKNPDGTVSGGLPANVSINALAVLVGTDNAETIIERAEASIARAKATLKNQLSAQLLGEERKARYERLMHLDGDELATRVVQEITERTEGDTAIVEQVNIIEAEASDGIAAAQAGIEQEASVRASAIAAETAQREDAVSTVVASVDGERALREAEIERVETTSASSLAAATSQLEAAISTVEVAVDDERLDRQAAITAASATNADALSAATSQLQSAISTVETLLDGERLDREAAITDERATSANALSAATSELHAAISQVQLLVDGERQDRQAAITEERNTSADEAGALASQVLDLGTQVGESQASIMFLLETANGEQAIAQLTTEVMQNGVHRVTGFKINGQESSFVIAADKFVVGNSQIFEVDTVTGEVSMNTVVVGKLKAGSVDTAQLKVGAVTDSIRSLSAATFNGSGSTWIEVGRITISAQHDMTIDIIGNGLQDYGDGLSWGLRILVDGSPVKTFPFASRGGKLDILTIQRAGVALSAGDHTVTLEWAGNNITFSAVDFSVLQRFA